MRIWDLHCHLAGIGQSPEEAIDLLVTCADRMGIERIVVFMGRPFAEDPSPDELRRQNDQVLRAIARHTDRALGFAYVSPKHVEASLAEIDRCVRDGPMVGLKLWVAARCIAPEMDPIVRAAAALDAPVFQHTWMKVGGNLPGESTPLDLAALAARHPDARFICGHAGGDWEQGIRAIRPQSKVSVELAGGFPTAGLTEMAIRELGASRILYGSDAPGRGLGLQLGKVFGAAISDEEKRLILGENLRRLLGPTLRAKAIRG